MKRNWLSILTMFLLASGAVLAASSESGTLLKSETIRIEPYRDARTIGSLRTGERVEIIGQQNGWYRIKSGRRTGWVRMLSVRRGDARPASGDGSLATGRAGTGRIVSTTGIRGLSEGELRAATFSDSELTKLESFCVSAEEAQRFAGEGLLEARRMDYLPEPKQARGWRP